MTNKAQDRLDKWAKDDDTPTGFVEWILANPHSAFDIAATAHAIVLPDGCNCPLHEKASKLGLQVE